MADVVDFTGATILDLPADKILEQSKGEFDHVVVIGVSQDGSTQVASSSAEVAKIYFWLECGKRDLFRTIEGSE